MKKVLVIQTSFIGDVILATALLEQLYNSKQFTSIDILIRKGNESLFENHPFINRVIIWNKQESKYKNLLTVIHEVRDEQYDLLINLQRYLSTGLISACSKARQKVGFNKNPLSFFYDISIEHHIGNGKHETIRNAELTDHLHITHVIKPKLHIPHSVEKSLATKIQWPTNNRYCCLAPASVWFTKQLPENKWIDLCKKISSTYDVLYLLGSKNDIQLCKRIKEAAENIVDCSGKLNLLESALLMSGADMNFVNDSAPLHLASATNAPTTVFFCSTSPDFGFGPLSENSLIIETIPPPSCKPCGLHGKKACPESHFKCGNEIDINRIPMP